jgi:hypothetical protein
LDAILHDIKGANLRRGFRRKATRRQRKHAVGLVSGTLGIVERHDGKLIGRIWVKQLNQPNDDMSIHASSLQFICSAFNSQLSEERGMVVVDSQTYQHNHRLAHSMFTQRFGKYPRNTGLVDTPVFGHSDNHAGLQIADLLCSAVLAPVGCAVYAGGYASWNRHCESGFLDIREEFGDRLEALTFEIVNPRTTKSSKERGRQRSHRQAWKPPHVGARTRLEDEGRPTSRGGDDDHHESEGRVSAPDPEASAGGLRQLTAIERRARPKSFAFGSCCDRDG